MTSMLTMNGTDFWHPSEISRYYSNSSVTNQTFYQPMEPCKEMTRSVQNQIFIFLTAVIFIIALLGNTFAIWIILTSKKLKKQSTNIFIASLAATDLGVAFFILPIKINAFMYDQAFCFSLPACKMFNITDILFHAGSVSHLFVIAIERFIAIVAPFKHQRFMTRKMTYTYVLLTWIYAVIWAAMGTFSWEDPTTESMIITILPTPKEILRFCINNNQHYFTTIFIIIYLIPLCIMGGLYTCIWRIAKRQVKMIASLNPSHFYNNTENGRRKSATKRTKQEIRATKTLSIVYGAFVICWLPLAMITLSSNFFPYQYAKFRLDNPSLSKFISILFIDTLPPLNSCLNPFVYILMNREFQRCAKKIIWKILRKPITYKDPYQSTIPRKSFDSRLSHPSIQNIHEIQEQLRTASKTTSMTSIPEVQF